MLELYASSRRNFMNNFKLDFGYLSSVINPDKSKVVYKGNEDSFVRIAFDLFKIKDNSSEDLWQIQADDDGVEYLVRTYETDDKEVEASKWSVGINKTASHLTVSYHGMPIHRLDIKDYGIDNVLDAIVLRDVVREKLAKNTEFVAKFANELPQEKRDMLVEMGAIDPAMKAKELAEFPSDVDYKGPGFKRNDVVDEKGFGNYKQLIRDHVGELAVLLTKYMEEYEGEYKSDNAIEVLNALEKVKNILK